MSETTRATAAPPVPPAQAGTGPTTVLPELTISATRLNPEDEVDLDVGGRAFSGWQEVRVTRGVERMPSDFSLTATEAFPEANSLGIPPGAPCKVRITGDLALTGYIDRYSPAVTPHGHQVTFTGRSKCADLVDSSAIFEDANGREIPTQISGASALEIAIRLAAHHGITVSAPDGPGPVIPQHNAMLTETAYEIIERIARFSRLLVYDDPDGNLVLAQVGTTRHASGFKEGVNVEAASAVFSWDQRFTHYDVLLLPVNNLGDVTAATGGNPGWNLRARVADPTAASRRHDGQPRIRRRVIMVEQQWGGEQLARERAQWEMARRYGRSQAVALTTDSWRDSAGVLWEPNRRVKLELPALKIVDKEWVIVEVTYRRGMDGTHADLVLMPPEALMPQPTLLLPFDAQMAEAMR